MWCAAEGGGGGGGAALSPLLAEPSAGSSLVVAEVCDSDVGVESKVVKFWLFNGVELDEWWWIKGPAGWKYPKTKQIILSKTLTQIKKSTAFYLSRFLPKSFTLVGLKKLFYAWKFYTNQSFLLTGNT